MPPLKESVKIEDVTVAKAAKWLEANTHNRPLRDTRVFNLIGALERGEWRLTGDSVVFDTNGVLVNGQHRLTAIVESGIPARLVVLRGVEIEAQDVMDRGLPRTLADALKLRDHSNWHTVAAGLNWLYRLEYIEKTGNVHYTNPGERPTTVQCLALLDTHPDFPDFARKSRIPSKILRVRAGVTAACWSKMGALDPTEADVFFDRLVTGLELKSDDPIYLLRRLLLQDANANARSPDYRIAALTCKAWNAWREGRTMATLSWRYGGSLREAFPLPR